LGGEQRESRERRAEGRTSQAKPTLANPNQALGGRDVHLYDVERSSVLLEGRPQAHVCLKGIGNENENVVDGLLVGPSRGRNLIGRNSVNLIVGWGGQFFLLCLVNFHKILASGQKIKFFPDWTYFHWPDATLDHKSAGQGRKISLSFLSQANQEAPTHPVSRTTSAMDTIQCQANIEPEGEEEEVKRLEARSASELGKAVERMCCSEVNVVVVRT